MDDSTHISKDERREMYKGLSEKSLINICIEAWDSYRCAQEELDKLKGKPIEIKDSEDRACPCKVLDEPCHPDCTCVNPYMSRGCKYCATYGSEEQRKAKAKYLKNTIENAKYINESIENGKEAIKLVKKFVEVVDNSTLKKKIMLSADFQALLAEYRHFLEKK